MKKSMLFTSIILASGVVNAATITSNIQIVGAKPMLVQTHPVTHGLATVTPSKYVMLEKIKLSSAAENYLAQNAGRDKSAMISENTSLAKKVEIGMNDTPVLDQGMHGTCVTFAITGILDAALVHGDYVSQLCNLELGSYLQDQDPEYASGWDGSFGPDVLTQIQKYGAISIPYQKTSGCAGVYSYPLSDPDDIGNSMSTDDFTAHSEMIMKDISWQTILSQSNAFSAKSTPSQVLTDVKTALSQGHRVAIGFLLDEYVGSNGALGHYKSDGDTWMMTPQIQKDAERKAIDAGHEVIITGYDDTATVVGPKNRKEKGVLHIRNSWGSDAGDSGDYYMSYNYFQTLAMEANAVVSPSDKPTAK